MSDVSPLEALPLLQPLSVSARDRLALQVAIEPLGVRPRALVHRVAQIGTILQPYDPWSTDVEVDPDAMARRSRVGLEARDLARPTRDWRDKLVAAPAPRELEGWFYEGDRLLARVVITGADERPGSARARRANALVRDWLRAHLETPREAIEGTLVVDDEGEPMWIDRTALAAWRGEPALVRLVREARRRPTQACRLLARGRLLSARRLLGAGSCWLVEVTRAPDLRVAADAVLTPTQRRVAHYAAVGATVEEIAQTVAKSPETVRSHLKSVYRRLDVANRVELARVLA